MSFRNTDDLCPSWWELLAPLCLLGAEGEMIAADWKHGIFQNKARSRPRDNVTNRGASMARGVTLRPQETLFHCFESGTRCRRGRRWCACQCRGAATFAPSRRTRSAFLRTPPERRVLGREKHAHMVAECRASQIISCHRPPNSGPTDRHRVQTAECMWESFLFGVRAAKWCTTRRFMSVFCPYLILI